MRQYDQLSQMSDVGTTFELLSVFIAGKKNKVDDVI